MDEWIKGEHGTVRMRAPGQPPLELGIEPGSLEFAKEVPMHRHTIYITYDLSRKAIGARAARGAKRVDIQGQLVRHEVGRFKTESGDAIHGVRLTLSLEDEEDLERAVIEIPARARNVQVHIDTLPPPYRSVLEPAA